MIPGLNNLKDLDPEAIRKLIFRYQETYDRDLALAQKIHESQLPQHVVLDRFDAAVNYVPYDRLGGDYATVKPLDSGRVFACVTDVSGHGIASALFVTRVNSFIHTHLDLGLHEPCRLINAVSQFLDGYFSFDQYGTYLSFFACLLDLDEGTCTYTGCGHPPAMHIRPSENRVKILESCFPLLGPFPEHFSVQSEESFPIQTGDRIFIHTDGLSVLRNSRGQSFDAELALEISKEQDGLNSQEIGNRIFKRVCPPHPQLHPDDTLLLTMTVR